MQHPLQEENILENPKVHFQDSHLEKQYITFCASFSDTLSICQAKLHSEGSRSSYRWRWRNGVDLHNQSLNSSARIPTLEEKPGQQTVSL